RIVNQRMRARMPAMNRQVLNYSLLWAACSVLFGVSCVERGSPLLIVQNQVPVIDTKMGTCTIPAARSMDRRPSGVLDVALDQSYPYELYPLLRNELGVLNGP